MKSDGADYQSFLVRIWRDDKAKASDDDGWSRVAKDSWLFQLEDIASGDTRYFHDIGELADYVDKKARSGCDIDQHREVNDGKRSE